ncbi:hypothetical protein [Mycobacterium sp. IDR2000157661]|uniref:hypothetical protein n=1 Tax=Mycobacterium sp. IDR2000157661 TaxID=2867005 RepID=UPI001EEB2D53|nr:hypothetical protein [Mycobacterium sp. IDR2000157661]ULE34109.1 hypothetical protein K3G64_05465 [Mycobacterium sp. IDR2000157661]
MLNRVLIGVLGSAGAALIGVPGIAGAQPPEPPPRPPLPNVNALAPVKLSEYAVMDGQWYAFKTPDGVTCVLQRSGQYGCSGPLPAAPKNANLVSGAMGGVPGFANANADVFPGMGEVKPLPVGSRISYQTVSCGVDTGGTSCVDTRNQSGFVLSPAGSFILNPTNPLLDRPEGTNPYFN